MTLDIDKNLTSKNGKFVMNTTLNNDLSPTDKLIIKGNTLGTARVIINNINGKGESTVNGIELIKVNGNSSGEFKLANRTVAGAYDYALQRGGHTKTTSNKNWYLTNVLIKTREKSPHQFNPTENEIELTTPIYRPKFGSYIKNLQAANILFHMTLHDRLGETRYTDALTMEHKVTSMWIRGVIGRNHARMGDDQLRSQANRSVIQIGGDLARWSANECNRYHLGGIVGYANHRSDTVSNIIDSGSISRTVGYSAGLYGTWYSNQPDQTGLYVNSWALYNWFDNEIHGDFQHNEKYKSRGATISAESGYTFKIYQYLSQNNLLNKFHIQPQAQITWMGVKAKTHIDKNGTKIDRLGLVFWFILKERVSQTKTKIGNLNLSLKPIGFITVKNMVLV